jgi:hypothetical protein
MDFAVVTLAPGRGLVFGSGTEKGSPASNYMARMRKVLNVVSLLLLLAWTGAAAEPSLLPDKFVNWRAVGPTKIQTIKDLRPDWTEWTSSSSGAVLREAGLTRLEERNYKNGSAEWSLKVITFRDPSSAFEAYTNSLKVGMENWSIGDAGAKSKEEGIILVGNFILFTHFYGNPDDLKEVVTSLRKAADPTPLPPLKGYLPEKGLLAGTQRYALGPEGFRASLKAADQAAYADLSKIAGFESGVESMLGRYKTTHGEGVLLLLEYPTPQLAEQHLHHLEEALPAEAKQAGVDVQRNASMLSLVFGAKSKEFAQELRKNVNYETQVVRNEAGQTLTDPPWVVVLSKIFFLTAIFLGVATGLGIAFGGVRVLTKRFFPGKVFDRPQDIEVLQMGLSGKKIDPSDMY